MDDKQATHSELLFISAIEKSIEKLIEDKDFFDSEAEDRYRYSTKSLRVKAYEGYFSPNRILYFQKSGIINPVYDEFQIFRMNKELDSEGGEAQGITTENISTEDKIDIYEQSDEGPWWSDQ